MGLLLIYPFLPGTWDVLAFPVSMTVQLLGAAGLLVVPVGFFWLMYERRVRTNRPLQTVDRGYQFGVVSLVVASIAVALVVLMVGLGTSLTLGGSFLVSWVFLVARWWPALKALKQVDAGYLNPAPVYVIVLPLATMMLQLVLAAPLTDLSRNRAIRNSAEFIRDIEAFHDTYGQYPITLTAQWKDYNPGVVGVEKFLYAPQGASYNLFFEQPRFLFDDIGAREWVVYNPLDEHRMYSHTSWFLLLSPEEVQRTQGWFAVYDAGVPHWKYFFFD
jgi:hypothetical protein